MMRHERFTDGSAMESDMEQVRAELQSYRDRVLPVVAEGEMET